MCPIYDAEDGFCMCTGHCIVHLSGFTCRLNMSQPFFFTFDGGLVMYACVYVCLCVHTCACVSIRVCVHVCVCIRVCVHACVHTCVRARVCAYVCVRACVCVSLYVCA